MGLYEFRMTLDGVLEATLGEMVDLINLLSVYNGSAKESTKMTFDEVMRLR